MKKFLITMFIATALHAGAGLVPDSFSNTWFRTTQAPSYMSTNQYLTGTTYLLSNNFVTCADNISTQDLTGLGIVLRVGNATTNLVFYGTTTYPTLGLFNCSFVIPPLTVTSQRPTLANVQLTLTNNSGVVVIFNNPLQLIVVNPLH